MKEKTRGAEWGFGLLCCFSSAACFSIKDAMVELTYPHEPPAAPPARDWTASVDAAVVPTLLGGYARPAEVGACLAAIAGDARTVGALSAFGNCTSDGNALPVCLSTLPGARPTGSEPKYALEFPCPAPPSLAEDKLALMLALAASGEAFASYRRRAFGPQANQRPIEAELARGLTSTLEHAARVLRADRASHDLSQPVLSLSGGAANGAFVAGYLYALLSARELAFVHGSAATRALLERERFGAAVGSSVGALIALPLDLYFSELTPNAAEKLALAECAAGPNAPSGVLPERAQQRCALARLRQNFAVNEWDLMCAQPGLAPKLLLPSAQSVARFDPLERSILAPFFARFGRLLSQDAFLRVAAVTELSQGLAVGLDERACTGLGAAADRCSISAILASVSEPLLAPPVKRVYSGLNGALGESGTWLDGGMTSVNPAARAVTLNRARVLALNTFRAHGTPQTLGNGLSPYIASTIVTLGTGLIDLELRYAAGEQERRRRLRCELGELTGEPSTCLASSTVGLLVVSVPEDIEPKALFASGYTFDPLVMRGLFLWGEKAFLRSRQEVLKFVGFCALSALDAGEPCLGVVSNPALRAALRAREQAVETELQDYAPYAEAARWHRHLRERRHALARNLRTCDH